MFILRFRSLVILWIERRLVVSISLAFVYELHYIRWWMYILTSIALHDIYIFLGAYSNVIISIIMGVFDQLSHLKHKRNFIFCYMDGTVVEYLIERIKVVGSNVMEHWFCNESSWSTGTISHVKLRFCLRWFFIGYVLPKLSNSAFS